MKFDSPVGMRQLRWLE